MAVLVFELLFELGLVEESIVSFALLFLFKSAFLLKVFELTASFAIGRFMRSFIFLLISLKN